MDYGTPSFRKSKNDKKAKGKFKKYKKGGQHRAMNISVKNKDD